MTDRVREAVAERADALGLTAYEIAKRTGGLVTEAHVCRFLAGRVSMGSRKLQHVLRVLALKIVEE
jgi:predicted transcriptional regulator